MIVRILGRGQIEVDDARIDDLNSLDTALAAAVESGDEAAFKQALTALVDAVCASGTSVPDDALVPSDIVIPDVDATLDDVRELLGDEGLIPG
jgi:hypothetical protein